MFLLIGAFFAGALTVLAPCVLPLLPVIVGGSMNGSMHDKRRPLIIAGSLATSLFVFTLLLKVTTLLIYVPPQVFIYASGSILVMLGIFFLFPTLYERLILALNLQVKSQQLLGKANGKKGTVGAIITGAALGPVFSSCSPVYAYILATVLPVNFGLAMTYILAYIMGLSVMLLLVGFVGQRVVRRLRFAANPKSWFNRTIAVMFIIVGIFIVTGFDKKFQTYISEYTPFDFDGLSAQLLPTGYKETNEEVLNVRPYPAPELVGLSGWINSKPLELNKLKGKVVLIDFWTYSCINCIRTQPYLREWDKTYRDSGLVIIGVHAPEFSFERNVDNVRDAAKKAGLNYPIALDNDFSTWNAYQNQYWPASYLIDKEGNVRRQHGGEGEYKATEMAIRELIAEKGGNVPKETTKALSGGVPVNDAQTPETYLGTLRASNFTSNKPLIKGRQTFEGAKLDRVNQWTLSGAWSIDSEGITAVKDSVLTIRFAAREMYVVPGNNSKSGLTSLRLNNASLGKNAGDDVANSSVNLSNPRLYKLVKFDSFRKDSTLELRVPAGVQLNVFTFGS